ncbi:hypothetical protein ABIE27_004101 [Paenibacillus sp. 4624]|uniref:hypothetical protein n=1 Tax=Paenibacillus sp. 4624 TaxID=3156453 RepID=UPI003D1AB1C7
MKFRKIPFWIIVLILVPLIYLVVVNPLFLIKLFSSIGSPSSGEIKNETRKFMEERYDRPFRILTLKETNLSGYYEGRGVSVEEDLTFSFAKSPGRDPQTDYRLNVWAKSLITPFVDNNEVKYEVDYQSPSLSFNDNMGLDYWDNNFLIRPEEVSIKISFMYTHKMSREQIFSIIKKMKVQGIGNLSILLYPTVASPDLPLLAELGFSEYYEKNTNEFIGKCEILNQEHLNDINDFEVGNSCLRDK